MALVLEGKGPKALDSLAYIDPLSADEKRSVEALIDNEMKVMKREGVRPATYVEHLRRLDSFHRFEGSTALRREMERIQGGQKHMPVLDMSVTELRPPTLQKQGDLAAWQQASSNAAAQLEHQHNRIVNLELAIKNAPASWRLQNARTEALLKLVTKELSETEAQCTQVNQRRKLQQDQVGEALQRLQSEYDALVAKNIEIEAAISEIEARLGAGQRPDANGSAQVA